MMSRKRIIALLALVGVIAVVIAAPWRTARGWRSWRPSIAGAWILAWDQPPGVETLLTTETLTPLDLTGRRLVYWCRGVNPMWALELPPDSGWPFPDADSGGDGVGTFVRTGRDSYGFTIYAHFGQSLGPKARGEVQYLWVYSGTAECTGANTMVKTGTLGFFCAMDGVPGLHNQDVNKDGFPDDGEEPFFCIPVEWVSSRVQVTAPYDVFPPMP